MKKLIIFMLFLFGFTLTACEEEPTIYAVDYVLNDGVWEDASTVTKTVVEGTTVAEPAVLKEGHTFTGWFTDSTLNVPYDFSTTVVGNLTLYAGWERITFEVVYYDGAEYANFTVDSGEVFPIPVDPTKEYNSFSGWYLDEDCIDPLEPSDLVNEDTNLYAKWEMNTYTVSFYDKDGNKLFVQSYYYGDSLTLPTEYEGEDIEGIYLADTYFDLVPNTFTMPGEAVNLYVKFVTEYQDELVITFIPARPEYEILEATASLPYLLAEELEDLGFPMSNISIDVSTSYEAAGEQLLNGTSHLTFMPNSMAAWIDNEEVEILVTSARYGITKDYDDAIDWNDGKATEEDQDYTVPYYRSLVIAGPSPAGQALSDKVNSGQTIVWEDLEDLTWCTRYYSSASGYIYPNYYLYSHFGYSFDDIASQNLYESGGYGDSLAHLALENCDVGTFYADARMHYADDWETYGRTASIWEETNVIFVTDPIMNDALIYNTDYIDAQFADALREAFLNIIETPEGQDVFQIYSITSFIETTKTDYATAREIALWLLQ